MRSCLALSIIAFAASVHAAVPAGHWAFQPVRKVDPPATKAPVTSPVDRFVLAKLEANGVGFAPAADARTLIRRAYYDLTGLPPTADEIDAFTKEYAATPQAAWEKLVDRLLASPRYGEAQARRWLDLARYADTKGYVFTEDRNYPYAYTYRDWVIRAFNEDMPYDRFVQLQVAADRMQPEDNRDLAAMGFLTLGRRFLNNIHDIIYDRLDVTSRTFLGLTLACARCHDHKFDPIPTADYYSLYGVFASSVEPKDLPQIGEVKRTPEVLAFEVALAMKEAAHQALFTQIVAKYKDKLKRPDGSELKPEEAEKQFARDDRDRLRESRRKIDAFKAASPVAPPRAMVLNDAPSPAEPYVFLRGNPGNRGPAVPRQFLQVVAGPKREPFHHGSGRLELARAIADPGNPLTARVMVNRLWINLFGKGLVRTPSDFGVRSDPPTHPELLDYLAATFVEGGWSVKKLYRTVMLSQAYQQSSKTTAEQANQDAENRLLGRQNRRRLDFEQMRDSLLQAAGTLDLTAGGRSVDLFKEPFSRRRSIYGFIERQNLPGTLRVFDFASPDQHSPQRFTTTVPQQALFLMNSPFLLQQSKELLNRREVVASDKPADRVNALYRIAYGRTAAPDEVDLGVRFVEQGGKWEQLVQALLISNEFCFID